MSYEDKFTAAPACNLDCPVYIVGFLMQLGSAATEDRRIGLIDHNYVVKINNKLCTSGFMERLYKTECKCHNDKSADPNDHHVDVQTHCENCLCKCECRIFDLEHGDHCPLNNKEIYE